MGSGQRFRRVGIASRSFAGLVGLVAVAIAAACSSSSGSGATPGGASDAAALPDGAIASNSDCKATIPQGALGGASVGTTCEYLGIPYGAPPVDALRFAPPQPAAGWTGMVRDATKFGPSCLQPASITSLGSTSGPAPSEDCLSVNVYTPKQAASQTLPVMVFIYGGAFTSGASSQYDPQAIAERGPVVFVTLNYRLGPLGYLALPELDAERPGAPSGSDGIRDQQLALRWVKDNIATFHGDPSNVTVFGESAGSLSTCIHLVSPGSQGLAKRYILESGSCVGPTTLVDTKAQRYATSAELAASFCGSPDGGTGDASASGSTDAGTGVMDCLRKVDGNALVGWNPPAGSETTGVGPLTGNLLGVFSPIVEGPGGVLPDLPVNLIAAGNYNKDAAIIAGTNKNEWGLFVELGSETLFGGSPSSPLDVTTVAQLDTDIETLLGPANAAAVEQQYPATDATAQATFITLVTDYAFRCPTRDLARATTANGTKNFFLYSYEIGHAYHSDELLALFKVNGLAFLGGTTPSAGFQSTMQGYWTQFAATGDPNVPGDAAATTWPGYDASTDQNLQLLDPTPTAETALEKADCDFWDTFEAAHPDGG